MNDTEMKYKIVEFGSLSQEERQTRAEEIAKITQEEPKMLSLSPQEVLDKEYLAFLVEKATDKVVSLVAISEPILNSQGRAIGEIGTMYTVPDHRGQGLAHILREHAENWARESEDYDGLCAFLCEESIRIFAEAGYSSKNATKVLPDNYFELCLDHCYLHEGAEECSQWRRYPAGQGGDRRDIEQPWVRAARGKSCGTRPGRTKACHGGTTACGGPPGRACGRKTPDTPAKARRRNPGTKAGTPAGGKPSGGKGGKALAPRAAA